MILIIGGAFQGKRQFAETITGKNAGWCDGRTAQWEEFCQSSYCVHLPAMVDRRMKTERDNFSGESFVSRLLSGGIDKILIGEEVGSGIVPMDAYQRRWREETGRIYCMLAEQAVQVWRVTGGIGQKIK